MIKYWESSKIFLIKDLPDSYRVLGWRNDPVINKWCRQFTDISTVAHNKWLSRIEEDPSIEMFGIYNSDEHCPVGVCGLTSINYINRTAEFSLYIAPGWQRKGYGKEALETLLAHGFWAFNLNRIWGETFDGNPAADMFLDIGMKAEGVLRESYFREGRYINSTVYSILAREFNDLYQKKEEQ